MASRTRVFFLNAISLTATALMIRAVSVIFNVYISNAAGSEAIGLFSLLSSVYAFSITLATAGINLGTTRLVSEAVALKNESLAKKRATCALLLCTVTGIISSILLFILSEPLAIYALGDVRAKIPLKVLSLTLTPIAICSCLSGYFTAVRRVKANAAFQLVSQGVKFFATVFLLSNLATKDCESACTVLVVGGAISEFFSFIINFSLYLFDRRKLRSKAAASEKYPTPGIFKELISINLPVTVSACIRSALSMIQHILIPRGLYKNGGSWSLALSSYGALHGMAMPLLLFPSAFTSAFAGLLIPEISACCAQKDFERLKRTSYRALSLSLFFSVGVSGIMLFFSRELGMTVYKNAEAALYIRVLAPLIPVMYIDSAVDAILKGSGHQVYSMNVNIADTLTACLFALTLVPMIGIWGYVISIYATEILNTSLSLLKLISVSKMRPKAFAQVFKPIICIIGATNIARLALAINPIKNSIFTLIAGIILSLLLYLALLFITKTVTSEETEFLSASLLSEKHYNQKYRTFFKSGNSFKKNDPSQKSKLPLRRITRLK